MGATLSRSSESISTRAISNAYNKCASANATNNIYFQDVNFTAPDDCHPASTITFSQLASVDSNCVLQNLQTSAAELAANLNSETQAGLGLSASNNQINVQNQIQENTYNSCANQSASNSATLKDVNIKACNAVFVQNASAKTACQINNTQDMLQQIGAKMNTKTIGGSLFGDLFGSGTASTIVIIVVVIIIIITIIGGIILILGRKKKK